MRNERSRGSILLEVVVSIAMFVAVGITILGVMGQGEAALRAARNSQRAMDLARSAMAAIEAGLATPQNVSTLVKSPAGVAAWLALDTEENMELGDGLDEGSMELEVEVEPTADTGLSLMTVRVGLKQRGGVSGPDAVVLRQLVRVVAWDATGGWATDQGSESGVGP